MEKIENSNFLIDVICNLLMEVGISNLLTTDACVRVELVFHITS